LEGCGTAHLGNAKASPTYLYLLAGSGGAREKELNSFYIIRKKKR
jgi:hypothetical protein